MVFLEDFLKRFLKNLQMVKSRLPDKREHNGNLFSYFLTKTYVVGSQKNRLNSFQHPKHVFKLMGKEISAILGAQTIHILTYEKVQNYPTCKAFEHE